MAYDNGFSSYNLMSDNKILYFQDTRYRPQVELNNQKNAPAILQFQEVIIQL